MKKVILSLVCMLAVALMAIAPNALAQDVSDNSDPFAHIPRSKDPIPVTIYYTDSGDIKEVKLGHPQITEESSVSVQGQNSSLVSTGTFNTYVSTSNRSYYDTDTPMSLTIGQYMKYNAFSSNPTNQSFFLGIYNGSYSTGYIVTSNYYNLYVQAPSTGSWTAHMFYRGSYGSSVHIYGTYTWPYN